MQRLSRIIEWYLGVPATEPGQGTVWTFNYHPAWSANTPHWVVLLLAVGLVAYVASIYWRDAKASSRKIRGGFIVLRLLLISVAFIFLTGLSLSIDRTGLPTIVLLIDDSASMGLEDHYKKEDEENIRQWSHVADSASKSRLHLVTSLLSASDGKFLKQILSNHQLRIYRFSEIAVPVGDNRSLSKSHLKELLQALKQMKATGTSTRPGPAIQKILNDLRGMPPSAIIVLTDGITTTSDSDKLTTIAKRARSQQVPLFVIGVGSEEPAHDLQLYDMLADEVAFVEDPITFSAQLKTFGYSGKKMTVTLRNANSKTVLKTKTIDISKDGTPLKVEIPYAPPLPGEYDYTLEVTGALNESDKTNNFQTRHVSVRQEKIRVLLADGYPRYEFRFLQHLLERDKTIILHTVLQDADLEYAVEDGTALEHFPIKREDLFRYDVIIMGDINLEYLSAGVLKNLRDFVRESGGGLISIAGMYFNPMTYRETLLEVMLPIELSGVKKPDLDATITESFQPKMTIEGRKGSAIFRFVESEEESKKIWDELPGFYWLLECSQLKPGAVTFVEHPSAKGLQRHLPVICMQRFGAGKVIFHATDELWRWRFRTEDLYYGRYWIQAIRYLSRSKLLGKDRGAELTVGRSLYQRGETIHLRLRFLDERKTPTQKNAVKVVLEGSHHIQRKLTLKPLAEAPNVFEGRIEPLPEGSYHAWVVSPLFQSAPPAVDFRVEAPVQELQTRRLDKQELTETARITHGRYYSIAEAPQLPDRLPIGQPVPLESTAPISLWNRWELLLLFTTLLLTEWLLRKRRRLV
ncbi:hypothetical protein MNBD_PLANCTO02-2705 [hydrothermal vent metagenome]|uniref:VWFA domain-containing protein n=1 Tax=hydrothermal vent metagenome TaxID=652676 RepID=A0A3B1DHL4_9ZZZZ